VERTNLMLYRVSLYRALGGTWTESLPDPENRTVDINIEQTGTEG